MRLFISYAHVDRPQVQQLVDILRVGGHDPWFDHSLIVGGDWQQQLLDAIQRSDAFVYALTPESVASEWCEWEFSQAIKSGKPIVPVLLQQNTKLPDVLKRFQYADFTNGATAEAVARLMGGLSSVTVTIPPEQAPSAPKNPIGTPSQAMGDASMPEVSPKAKVNWWNRLNSQLVVALVAGIFVILAAIITGVLNLIPYLQTQAATATAAVVETQNVFASRTALALVPTSTNTPLPTFTATAMNTQKATAAATETATNTLVPPTSTPTLTNSPTPTFTAIPPTTTTAPILPTGTPLPSIPPATARALTIPSATPGFPCDAHLIGTNPSVRVDVFLGDSGYDNPATVPFYQAEPVRIKLPERAYGKLWYQLIDPQSGNFLGYVQADQVVLSANCPQQ